MGLGVGVLEDRPAAGLDQQHLARPEPATSGRLGRRERHGPGLRGDRDQPVPRHRERRRAEPVAVDQRADPSPVGEHDGRRPVPWGEHAGGPPPERRDVGVRCATQPDRLGDRREQRRWQLPAGRRQELEPLVERQRIRAIRREQRPGVEQLGREPARATVTRATAHLLAVAAHGVDLAVVGDRPERLGEPPDRRRVRGVALVEDRVRDIERRAEIRVQLGQPRAGDQSLVHDGEARRGRDRQLADRAPHGSGAPPRAAAARRRVGARRPGPMRRPGARRSPGRRAGARPTPPSRAHPAGTARTATPRSAGPPSANVRSTRSRAARAADRPRGRNSITTAGRSSPSGPAISERRDGDSGRATPAPSLDSPSAANAPRWASAARPASASGSTRPPDRPPASATNPTPHASCSKRASYSGAR